jgi:hypothetical protein
VGFFGRFVYSDGAWGDAAAAGEYLALDVHDSSVATVDYAPVLEGSSGRCFLGYEPRHYFEDETASDPVDPAAEARGLISWAAHVTGENVPYEAVKQLLADPKGAEPADVFVEDTSEKLIRLLGLPVPPDLAPTA